MSFKALLAVTTIEGIFLAVTIFSCLFDNPFYPSQWCNLKDHSNLVSIIFIFFNWCVSIVTLVYTHKCPHRGFARLNLIYSIITAFIITNLIFLNKVRPILYVFLIEYLAKIIISYIYYKGMYERALIEKLPGVQHHNSFQEHNPTELQG